MYIYRCVHIYRDANVTSSDSTNRRYRRQLQTRRRAGPHPDKKRKVHTRTEKNSTFQCQQHFSVLLPKENSIRRGSRTALQCAHPFCCVASSVKAVLTAKRELTASAWRSSSLLEQWMRKSGVS